MDSLSFIEALESRNLKELEPFPKSDLHNHGMLGSRLPKLFEFAGEKKAEPPQRMSSFKQFEDYLNYLFDGIIGRPDFFETMLTSAFRQAKSDGITLLQISIDSRFYHMFPEHEQDMVKIIERVRVTEGEGIRFVPQLGIDRTHDFSKIDTEANALIETGYFTSIDLYGEELYGDNSRFIPIYKKAQAKNMTLCAHAGEYGDAASVRHAVEMFELSQVQHGIAAADSTEIMKWLSDHTIILNVCPTSNVKLCRVASLQNHPIAKLFDHGVKVTINTDDLMIFGNSVSEEYLAIFNAGVLPASALETIRQCGLHTFYKES
jgi:adenosine deaminase